MGERDDLNDAVTDAIVSNENRYLPTFEYFEID